VKPAASLIVSVIAADYAFLVGGYSPTAFITAIIQKRRKDGKSQGVAMG